MTMKVRVLLVATVILAEMWLVGCGHYVCDHTFGASSCSSSSGGITQGSGGNGKGATYLFIADAGGIQGEVLDASAGTIKITPGFGTVSVPTKVPGDWMATAQGKFMYTAYTAIGDIYGWSIAVSGILTSLSSVSPLPATYLLGASGGPQQMITNPAGTLLFVADPINGQVHVYQIGSAGLLTELTPAVLPSGFKPFNLAVDGQGKYLFVSNIVGLATTGVEIYTIGSNGTLTAVGAGPVPAPLQQMQGEASGKYMVATTGGFLNGNLDKTLYVVSVASIQTGTVTATTFPTSDAPVTVAVQPSTGGNLVYSFDVPGTAGNGLIEGYTLDSGGLLSLISGSPFTVGGASGQFDQNGQYLFVTTSSSGVPSALDAFHVGATSTLGTPLATVGWAPGAWQAVDTP